MKLSDDDSEFKNKRSHSVDHTNLPPGFQISDLQMCGQEEGTERGHLPTCLQQGTGGRPWGAFPASRSRKLGSIEEQTNNQKARKEGPGTGQGSPGDGGPPETPGGGLGIGNVALQLHLGPALGAKGSTVGLCRRDAPCLNEKPACSLGGAPPP